MSAKKSSKPKATSKVGKLLYACDSDWYYATRLISKHPRIWYQDPKGASHTFTSSLDFAELRNLNTVDNVYNWNDVIKELDKSNINRSMVGMLTWLLKKNPPDKIQILPSMPIDFYQKLEQLKIPLEIIQSQTMFPQRVIKTKQEINFIQQSQALNEDAFRIAFSIIAEADIMRDKSLIWKGKRLTSELLRGEMEGYLARNGAHPYAPTIISCGAQSGHAHKHGHGILKANEFILIDSFPKGPNGYCGDLSRTIVKGKASQWHQDVYGAVLGAMEYAFSQLRDGAQGRDIHNSMDDYFDKAGMPSGTDKQGNPYGWKKMQGLGHSLGLDVHDPGAYTLNSAECILKTGMITTVEPGLYYPTNVSGGIGGCRIEDIVTITKTGYTNLTTLPKTNWIID